MKQNIVMSFAMLFAALTFSAWAQEPKNLELNKITLIKYHDSGAYQKDQARVIDKAMEYLKIRLAKQKRAKNPKKLALVLDIDETSLSNYPDMVRMDFGGTLQQILDAENKGTDPVIPATLELYRYAKANHIAVFFITGRTEAYRAATERNLLAVGYKDWDGLVLKSDNYHEKSASFYKIGARESLVKQNYDVILSVGDQQSDLIGGFADKTFKLPNPYYFIP